MAIVRIAKAPDFSQVTAKLQADQPRLAGIRDEQAKAAAEAAQEAARAVQAALDAQLAAQQTQVAYTAPTASGDPMTLIFEHESGNRTDAINASSGACGLGQALPCQKLVGGYANGHQYPKLCDLTDRPCQVDFFTEYAVSRYGSWANAWAFWQLNSWW